MTANENKVYLELTEKYRAIVNMRKVYACDDAGNIIEGMAFFVDGFTAATLWRETT